MVVSKLAEKAVSTCLKAGGTHDCIVDDPWESAGAVFESNTRAHGSGSRKLAVKARARAREIADFSSSTQRLCDRCPKNDQLATSFHMV